MKKIKTPYSFLLVIHITFLFLSFNSKTVFITFLNSLRPYYIRNQDLYLQAFIVVITIIQNLQAI